MGTPYLPFAMSLPEDKPKIMFVAFMMFVQNFGFFVQYYSNYHFIPGGAADPDGKCDDLRFWVALFALDCFVESFVCIWMAMAGYTDDAYFCFYWVLHLLVALPYVLCTITIPLAIYDEDKGVICRQNAGSPLYPLVASYWLHLSLFFVYVAHMLMVTYYSFLKQRFYPTSGSSQI